MAEERDRQSAGASRSLTGNSAYSLTYRPSPGQPGSVTLGTGADWFGPLNPMAPTAPPEVKGRILDYPSGYNLNVRPRSYNTISFDMLRAFADNYDLLRILIETRKDQMARLKWDVIPRAKETKKRGAIVSDSINNRIQKITDFFLRPDKENFWDDWLRMLLEDVFVVDAPAIYRRKTVGGDLYALQPIDGATIKRVIDDWGNTPLSPTPAYQQVLKGYPAVDYTTDELIYRPRNKRTSQIYGYSPVEQIVMTINIGMRRQVWQLQSFTEGNIPEALIGTPATWTPDQVRQFQDWFDSMLEGNTGNRRKARFVPGDVAKGYIPTKPDELFGAAEDWLVRVMCFAFNVSPQPFIKMMNRATAESAQEAAAAEGLAPIQNWVKNLMDALLIDDFDSPDLEFVWLEEDEIDPNIKSQIVDREQSAGRLTYNEARREQGLDPDPHPDANRPMTRLTDGTWSPIFATPEEQAVKDQMAALAATPSGGPEDGPEDGPEGSGGTDAPPGAPPAPGDTSPTDGSPQAVAARDAEKLDKGVAKTSAAPFPHRHGPGCNHAPLEKAGKASNTNRLYADPLRPFAAKIEKNLATKMAVALKKLGSSVRHQMVTALSRFAKADYPDDLDIDKLLSELNLDVLTATQDELEEALATLASDSARIALAQIGKIEITDDLVEQVNERALEYAAERAAELVVEDDEFLLGGATLDMLRSLISDGIEGNLSTSEIGDSIEEAYAFSEDRAQLIAATEITSANSEGALAGYKEASDIGVDVQKSWLVLEDGCPICEENAAAGAIDLDEDFPSGDSAPGAHPNCRCVLVPVVTDAQGNETEGDEGDLPAGDDMEMADQPDFVKQDRESNGQFGGGSGMVDNTGKASEFLMKSAMDYRQSDVAQDLNKAMRDGTLTKEQRVMSKDMQNLTTRQSFAKDAVVYRGASGVDLAAMKDSVGSQVKLADGGFVSSSKSQDVAWQYAGNGKDGAIFAISTKEGQTGFSFEHHFGSDPEREVVMPKDSTFKITSVDEKEGIVHLERTK